MLSDPQSITVSTVAKSMPLVKSGEGFRAYEHEDGYRLTTKQTTSQKRFRREVRIEKAKIAADPLTAVNNNVSCSVYVVIDEPRNGFTDAELLAVTKALKDFMSDAMIDRILDGEM